MIFVSTYLHFYSFLVNFFHFYTYSLARVSKTQPVKIDLGKQKVVLQATNNSNLQCWCLRNLIIRIWIVSHVSYISANEEILHAIEELLSKPLHPHRLHAVSAYKKQLYKKWPVEFLWNKKRKLHSWFSPS